MTPRDTQSQGLDSVTWRDDGSATTVTVDGDMLDHICWRHYGHEWDTVEAAFDANPGLADHGPVLPAGVTILLPHVATRSGPPRQDIVRLFD